MNASVDASAVIARIVRQIDLFAVMARSARDSERKCGRSQCEAAGMTAARRDCSLRLPQRRSSADPAYPQRSSSYKEVWGLDGFQSEADFLFLFRDFLDATGRIAQGGVPHHLLACAADLTRNSSARRLPQPPTPAPPDAPQLAPFAGGEANMPCAAEEVASAAEEVASAAEEVASAASGHAGVTLSRGYR